MEKYNCAYDELIEVHKLINHPQNPNKHSEDQIERLSKIIDYQGQRSPVVVCKDTGFIIVGHGRKDAMKKLGWEKIAVNYQKFDDDAQRYAHMTADNAIGSWSDLDLSQINMDMLDLGPELDLDMLGLKDFIIEPIEKLDPQCDADEVPELKEDPITKRGDVWLLGKHRLMCGDSTMIDDVEKLMNGEKADMVFTSPPYNGDTHLDYGKGENKKLYENNTDKWSSGEYIEFCHEVLSNLFSVTSGFIFWNVMYNAKSRFEYIKCIEPYIENLWETIAWKKTGMPLSNGLTRSFEFVFCFKNGERKHLSKEFQTENNLWDISNIGAQNKSEHRACFPVGLPLKGIELGSEEGQVILEPFCGSGTSLIACEKSLRKCYSIEMDEKYCDLIVNRYMKFTGRNDVTLESTGEKYIDLKQQRDGIN